MKRLPFLVLTVCLFLFSCGQKRIRENKSSISEILSSNANISQHEQLTFDTGKIAILPLDSADVFLSKDAAPFQLTNQEMQTIDSLLAACINIYNSKQDITKEFSEYIDLKKYKKQYVAFIDGNCKKKVYVNGFCSSDWGFDYWKNSLVIVEDGGSCLFHLTINLSTDEYEQLYRNGYA